MLENAHDPRSVTLSIRLYRRLVLAYPRSFRQEYGIHMAQVFRDCCRRAYIQGGTISLLTLWARTGLDYLKTLVEEYTRRGTNMTREKFVKLSGWALMLAGIVLFAGFSVGGGETVYDDPLGGIDGFYEYGQLILIPSALFLFTIGMTGLLVRYRYSSGRLGVIGLVIAVMGGVLSFISAIPLYAMMAPWMGDWWYFMIYSMVGMLAGLSLFGFDALRWKPMGRWNGLPLLTAVWFPALAVLVLIIESSGGSTDPLDNLIFVAMLFWVVGSIGLGYLLQKDAQLGSPASPLQA
jgi:hypothetical protein